MKNILTFGFLLFALLAFAPQSTFAQEELETGEEITTEEEVPVAADIMSTLEAEGNYTILIGALERTGLADLLREDGTYTLFAPTDEAFAALPENTVEEMSDDELRSVLQHHLATEAVTAEAATTAGEVATAGETMLKINEDGTMVNNATIVEADLAASNGVIHGIDTVLIPPAKQPN